MMALLTKEHLAIATKNGIKIKTVYNRVYNEGWDVEEAITQPKKINRDMVYEEWRHIAEKNGISQNTFSVRRRYQHMTPEQAATTPKMRKGLN